VNECKPLTAGMGMDNMIKVKCDGTGAMIVEELEREVREAVARGQGLTLVHFSAQPKPFLTLNTSPERLNTPFSSAFNTP